MLRYLDIARANPIWVAGTNEILVGVLRQPALEESGQEMFEVERKIIEYLECDPNIRHFLGERGGGIEGYCCSAISGGWGGDQRAALSQAFVGSSYMSFPRCNKYPEWETKNSSYWECSRGKYVREVVFGEIRG